MKVTQYGEMLIVKSGEELDKQKSHTGDVSEAILTPLERVVILVFAGST